jgi:hypothetical protein
VHRAFYDGIELLHERLHAVLLQYQLHLQLLLLRRQRRAQPPR